MRGSMMLFLMFLAGGCPYQPDLGTTPFLCGTEDPKCPGGYDCQADQAGQMVCVKNGSSAIPDAPPVNCANDSALEPNDTKETAYPTPVADTMMHITYTGLAICPGTDKDTYKINVSSAARTVDVLLTYEPGTPLTAVLLDAMGTMVAGGTPMGTDQVNVHTTNTGLGVHFVQVSSPTSNENNYQIEITASP